MSARDINMVVVGGTILKKFQGGVTKKGISFQSVLLESRNGRDYPPRFWVSAYGDRADQLKFLEEGQYIIVGGTLNESSYQKDDEWHKRVEVLASQVTIPTLSEESEVASVGADDDAPW